MGQQGQPPVAPPGSVLLVLPDPLTRADIPGLCDRLQALLRDADAAPHADGTPGRGPARAPVICDVGEVTQVDTVTLDALARLQLTARRLGHRAWLSRASPRLRLLITLAGLGEALPFADTGPPGPPAPGIFPAPRPGLGQP